MFIYHFRTNEDRLRRLGKSLSLQSKQYRAKRINVNIKTNVLAYSVELLGMVIVFLSSHNRRAEIMYCVSLIWYGNVIPSCYLINSNYCKDTIMDDGWTMAITKLYHNNNKKDSKCSVPNRGSKGSKINNTTISSSTNPPEEEAIPKRALNDETSGSIPKDILNFQHSENDAIDLDRESTVSENPPGVYIIRMKSNPFILISEEHSRTNANILLPNQVDCS